MKALLAVIGLLLFVLSAAMACMCISDGSYWLGALWGFGAVGWLGMSALNAIMVIEDVEVENL